MWEIAASEDAPQVTATPEPAVEQQPVEDTENRPVRRGGRVKTRLLGFERSSGQLEDVQGNVEQPAALPVKSKSDRYPVGWIIVLKGPGRGESTSIKAGVSQIGRGEDQAIQLDFGDTSISRENHATIAYDDEQRKFFIGHGGKSNLVRLNEKPVLSTEDLYHGDLIRIGQTTLLFLALCGENFSWSDEDEAPETTDE
ncbi:FHA domain-containing protein [Sulfitobacter sp. 1151]|uniref:FHA domain-containing protein n=2 Tax=Parasulfitobacter algicola TaxID=2614809 RepID=A0ABX2IMA9_9RHOB|nr:FHA domain-containing protein [Sulfitobacter algicola]